MTLPALYTMCLLNSIDMIEEENVLFERSTIRRNAFFSSSI